MVVVMKRDSSVEDIKRIEEVLISHGLSMHVSNGSETTIIGVIGDKERLGGINLEVLNGVEKCLPVMCNYKLASREICPRGRVVKVGNEEIGTEKIAMIAGPCAVESEEQIMQIAFKVKEAGAKFLRGGAYKPRTSPYSFQGLEEEGLRLIRKAADATGLKVVSEVLAEYQLEVAVKYCDMFQIGARNMQNFKLLEAVGKYNVPVLLKRGIASTIDEWLYASEYIMNQGNYNIVLCERGIRTFETSTKNTLDISSVAVVKGRSSLPIIVDPSHAAGKFSYIESLSLASVAAGADGLMIEVHSNPHEAVSDGAQQLTPDLYANLFEKVKKVAFAVERTL